MFSFYRIATCTPVCRVADTSFNLQQIREMIQQASKAKAAVAVFPELAVTTASCGDIFFDSKLLKASENAIAELLEELPTIAPNNMIVVIGAPVRTTGKLYDAALVLQNHSILAIVPKSARGGGRNAADSRWFASGARDLPEYIRYAGCYSVPFGKNLIIESDGSLRLAIEVGDDTELPIPPAMNALLAGANLLVVPAASADFAGAAAQRRARLEVQSIQNCCAVAYASSGVHETTTDGVNGGHQIVAEAGDILLDSPRFQREGTVNFTDVDLGRIDALRLANPYYKDASESQDLFMVHTVGARDVPSADCSHRFFQRHPFIAESQEQRDKDCEDIFSIQAAGLAKRMEHAHSQKLILGISGGLDSTLALLVSIEALRLLKRPASDLITVTMPGFGTSGRTYTNAVGLCKALKTTLREISIKDACLGHFKDIGHDPSVHDVVYENSQARERTQILLDIANQVNGLLVGTGDLSEIAMGWCTYNGDHISLYGVNGSVPKSLIPTIITWVGKRHAKSVRGFLQDVIDTPVSPELLPADAAGNIQQKTEDIIGPYEVHDFFIYHFMTQGASPEKLLFMATKTFTDISADKLKLYLKGFLRRFFTQQFKRSCSPDCPKATPISLSPRGALAMPSDACVKEWLDSLE